MLICAHLGDEAEAGWVLVNVYALRELRAKAHNWFAREAAGLRELCSGGLCAGGEYS